MATPSVSASTSPKKSSPLWKSATISGLIFLSVTAGLAAAPRLWRLNTLPPQPTVDEAANGTDILKVKQTGDWHIFYPNNGGREGLFINLQALSVFELGPTLLALRLPAALAGTATVVGVWFLLQEIYPVRKERKWIALLGALLLAGSFWHILISRVGLRLIMAPLFLVWTFFFWARAERVRSNWWAGLAGLTYGLGWHTYIAFRATLLLLPLLLTRQHSTRRQKALFLGMALLVVAPLVFYFASHPGSFSQRIIQVSTNPSWESKLLMLSFNIIMSVLQFFTISDYVTGRTELGMSQVWTPVSLLMIYGAFYSRKMGWRWGKLLTAWLIVGLLPLVLVLDPHINVPHNYRGSLILPAVFALAALGYGGLTAKWAPKYRSGLAVILVSSHFIFSGYKYFTAWADLANLAATNPNDQRLIAEQIKNNLGNPQYVCHPHWSHQERIYRHSPSIQPLLWHLRWPDEASATERQVYFVERKPDQTSCFPSGNPTGSPVYNVDLKLPL